MQIDETTYVSPNFNERPDEQNINSLLIHTTEGNDPSDAEWLCNPNSGVSSHYYIDPYGIIYRLVKDKYRAWHAGESYYAGYDDWNDICIGVEVSHLMGQKYNAAIAASLTELSVYLITTYQIPQELIAAHRWVATPYGRKVDPTDFDDTEFRQWVQSLYTGIAAFDPLRARQLQGSDRAYYCSVKVYDTYTKSNGLWWAGYPTSDETRATDSLGVLCTFMDCQRLRIKRNPNEGLRPALLTDVFTPVVP